MSEPIDWEEREYNRLTGRYKHYCPDWDGLPIDETCEEMRFCLCYDTGIVYPPLDETDTTLF